MSKELPISIERRVDQLMNKNNVPEFAKGNEYDERTIKKLDRLRGRLKKEIREKIADGEITHEEWKDIYNKVSHKLPKSGLYRLFMIRGPEDLKDYILGNRLAFRDWRDMNKKILKGEIDLEFFWENLVPQIAPDQVDESLWILIANEAMDESIFLHAEKFGKSSRIRQLIDLLMGEFGPETFFKHADQIKSQPWGLEAIDTGAKQMLPDELRSNVAYLPEFLRIQYLNLANELEEKRKGPGMGFDKAWKLYLNVTKEGGDEFWKEVWRSMTPDEIGEVIYNAQFNDKLSLDEKMSLYIGSAPPHLEPLNIKKYRDSVWCKRQMLKFEESGSYKNIAHAWEGIKDLPWAKEILERMVKKKRSFDIKEEAKDLDEGSFKRALLREVVKKERQEKPFRKLIKREIESLKKDEKERRSYFNESIELVSSPPFSKEKILKRINELIKEGYLEKDSIDFFEWELKEGPDKKIEITRVVKLMEENYIKEVPEDLLRKVMEDPALRHLGKVQQEWVKDLAMESSDRMSARLNNIRIWSGKKGMKKSIEAFPYESYLANAQAIVARNLFFQGRGVDKENVKAEVKRLIEVRRRYRDVPIFKDRNVVFVAHNEQKKSDKNGDLNRFGKKLFTDRIEADGGKLSKVIRAEETIESLKQKKQEILNKIKTTKPPFTFVFDGHGSPEGLFLSDAPEGKEGEWSDVMKITVEELFEAYQDRPKSSNPHEKDIFILASCFNATFIRHFYELCDAKRVSKPIFAGESEYGQVGYSENESKYGEDFFQSMFDPQNPTSHAKLGNLIDNDAWNKNSNPSIYIPDENNKTMQLSENERQQDELVDQFA